MNYNSPVETEERNLNQFARKVVSKKLLLLLVVTSQLFLLVLQSLDLLQQCIADVFFLLFSHQLLAHKQHCDTNFITLFKNYPTYTLIALANTILKLSTLIIIIIIMFV